MTFRNPARWLITLLTFSLFAVAAKADTLGIAVNGTCEVGSCAPTPIPLSTTVSLSFDFDYVLANGDTFLINGSMTSINSSDGGAGTLNTFAFQVTYEGNASGGPSGLDTIGIDRLSEFATTALEVNHFNSTLIGAFSPDIAAGSSASTCFDVNLNCLGPVSPPGSFDESSGPFTIIANDGTIADDKSFVSVFGAGSPVGSYIVWGQSTPIPPAPEPSSLVLLLPGLGLIVGWPIRRLRGR